ncbi:MAG: hypothetical protein OHK0013_00190 [Sandaracinaceae bacterium]
MFPSAPSVRSLKAVESALAYARHVLPAQGPIGVFVHHNTLHAFQDRPFHEAIAAACALHDAQGYLSEARFREEQAAGRIDEADLAHALGLRDRERPNHRLGAFEVRDVERVMLMHPIEESASGIRWAIEEGGMLDQAEARALLAACEALVRTRPLAEADVPNPTVRDLLLALEAPDPALVPNAFLQRFLVAYLDEGVAQWPMPGRERGLLACALEVIEAARVAHPILRAARRRLRELRVLDRAPEESILALCHELGYPADGATQHDHDHEGAERGAHGGHGHGPLDRPIARHLLSLPGFAGMVSRLESTPGDRDPGAPPASLAQLTVLRLALDLEAARDVARGLGVADTGPGLRARLSRRLEAQRPRREADRALVRAHRLFQVARRLELRAHDLAALDRPGTHDDPAARMLAAIDAFDARARQRTFHEAYEHHHLREIVAAVAHNRDLPAAPASPVARFQAVFCIDDREEGIRRHFESLGRDHVTFGVAGFFGVAMQFTSLDNPFASALCPVVVTPGHVVREASDPAHAHLEARRRLRRALWARARHEVLGASRSLGRGALLTAFLGAFSIVPLVLRVAFPRWSDRMGKRIASWLLPAPRTRLMLARPDEPHDHDHAHDEDARPVLPAGFTLAERVQRVKGTLENMGLTAGFAPLVALFGHGASSVNNPHQSAYDCGACGGRNGGPNARAFAAMANDPAVRAGLRAVGIDIPDGTWFVGGLHDTTTDAITLFDTHEVPAALRSELDALRASLEAARRLSAHERCRRFEHADPDGDLEEALRHVEERAVDLSQARPEYNHAANAACIVGRRGLTRGLFLDRRAFLVSYDPSIDDDGAILARILGAVVPVGAGINLEYLFSTVDPEVWGAGSKLPHNLAALLGVMEGASGDLRTGLPKQMTEIHEPVRLLCVIEASVDTILGVAAKNAEVRELVTRGWVRTVSLDPDTGAVHVFGPEGFVPYEPERRELPEVRRWDAWYRGRRDHLPPARIGDFDGSAEAAA